MPRKLLHMPRPPARSVGDTPLPTSAEGLRAFIYRHLSGRASESYKLAVSQELMDQPLEKLRAMAQQLRERDLEREERRRERRKQKAAAANG
jgi:hypothetical protein